MRHGSLFSGIGGFDCAASWVGWENSFHTEIDPFCRIILKHHFPNATTYTEIRNTDFTPWRNRIDVLSGGFPCPPFSQAGKRKGTADDRYLWPEMFRAIREIQPRWVVAENVLGIVNWNGGLVFEQVHLDLEAAGYSVQTFVLPACGINAPHQRYRTWFVAHRNDDQLCAGLQLDQWDWQTSFTDGSTDVSFIYRNGACMQTGSAGEPCPEPGGVCRAGRFGTSRDDNGAEAEQIRQLQREPGFLLRMDHGLLPTPVSVDMKGGMKVPGKKYLRKSGYMATALLRDLAFSGLLPTPKAGDSSGGSQKVDGPTVTRPSGHTFSTGLRDQAYSGLLPIPITGECSNQTQDMLQQQIALMAETRNLPTPTVSCHNAGTDKDRKDGGSRESELNHLVARSVGRTSQLSPLFVEEMMGFPTCYTVLPFLDGAKSQ